VEHHAPGADSRAPAQRVPQVAATARPCRRR
jgi:hypothetical protein